MIRINHDDMARWGELLRRARVELAQFSAVEQDWLRQRLDRIAALQQQLDALFSHAGGVDACAVCDGACCACGRHHLTLTNLLGYLLAEEAPPLPDFTSTCPFLGATGCLLPVARRPFNCITFLCDVLEDQLSPAEVATFYRLEGALRQLYEEIAMRCPGAGLRGIWLSLDRLAGRPLLKDE